MTEEIKKILQDVSSNKIDPEAAYKKIKKSMFINVDDIVKFDQFRDSRTGVPEVIYSESKTPETCISIAIKVLESKEIVLFTRLKKEHKQLFKETFSSSSKIKFELDDLGNSIILYNKEFKFKVISGTQVGIITAGTSDIPVAKEAEAVLKIMGISTKSYYDIGVAGLHRLIDPLNEMLSEKIDVLIVLAGMEGALPSVIAGLIDVPVIAVPVSVGYGIRPAGEVALLSMLNSCSPGIGVVNIDAGFNAGALAGLIALRCNIKNN